MPTTNPWCLYHDMAEAGKLAERRITGAIKTRRHELYDRRSWSAVNNICKPSTVSPENKIRLLKLHNLLSTRHILQKDITETMPPSPGRKLNSVNRTSRIYSLYLNESPLINESPLLTSNALPRPKPFGEFLRQRLNSLCHL